MKQTFGEWLKKARAAKGMNSTDLAAAAGLTQPAIAAYEAGIRNPKRVTAEALASALGIPASEVLIAAGFAPNDRQYGSQGLDLAEVAALPEDRQRVIRALMDSWSQGQAQSKSL